MERGTPEYEHNITGQETEDSSLGSKLKELNTSEGIAVRNVTALTLQLETNLLANGAMRLELSEVKSERDLALSQKEEFKSQLDIVSEKFDRIALRLQEVESARHTLEERSLGFVQEVALLNAQLSSEQHNVAELRQSLRTANGNLALTHTQLTTAKDGLSDNKYKLKQLQAEFSRARDNSETERQELSLSQAASLTRIGELMQEMESAKTHPFRTFFVNLFQIISAWMKLVVANFTGLGTRKALASLSMQENVSSA